MKKIFTFLFAVCLVSAVHAQKPSTSAAAPANKTQPDVKVRMVEGPPPATDITSIPANTPITGTAPATATTTVDDNVLSLKETEFDFGKIPQGKPVTHVFEVTNKSNVPLKIANINASCGCTTPEWEKDKVVEPGGNTKITVGYNAAAEGPFTKFITVSYNETQTKQIIIKGEVWKTPGSSAPENKGLNDLKN